MISDGMPISSRKAWEKITEGKAASKLPPDKKEGGGRLANAFKRGSSAMSVEQANFPFSFVCVCVWTFSKGEGLKSHDCRIDSFISASLGKRGVSPSLSLELSQSSFSQPSHRWFTHAYLVADVHDASSLCFLNHKMSCL